MHQRSTNRGDPLQPGGGRPGQPPYRPDPFPWATARGTLLIRQFARRGCGGGEAAADCAYRTSACPPAWCRTRRDRVLAPDRPTHLQAEIPHLRADPDRYPPSWAWSHRSGRAIPVSTGPLACRPVPARLPAAHPASRPRPGRRTSWLQGPAGLRLRRNFLTNRPPDLTDARTTHHEEWRK